MRASPLAHRAVTGGPAGRRRIAIIAGQLVVGGAERQLYLWLSNLNRDRFDPIVVTLKRQPGDYWERPIEVLRVPLLREPHSRNPLLRLNSLVRLLKPWRPELIHAWHLFASPYAGACGKILGAASLGSLRSSAESFRTNYWEGVLTERLVDAVLVNSSSVAADLARAGRCRRQRIFVAQNAVAGESQSRQGARCRLADSLDLPHDAIWIGTMARMVPKKGFEPLLDVFGSLRKEGLPIMLVLAGDGPLRPGLEARVEALNMRHAVRFAGEDPDARGWLGALDIFCYLSTYPEGLPNALLEAAAAGLPIVGWRETYAEEILSPAAHGGLVPTGDLGQCQSMLRRLIALPQERAVLGRNAQDHVTRSFSLSRYVSSLAATYEEVLA